MTIMVLFVSNSLAIVYFFGAVRLYTHETSARRNVSFVSFNFSLPLLLLHHFATVVFMVAQFGIHFWMDGVGSLFFPSTARNDSTVNCRP